MSEQLQYVSTLLQQEKFTEIVFLIKENRISFNNYYIALRKDLSREKPVFSLSSFWLSELPLAFLFEVLNSPLKISFYEKYFSKETFCNAILNQELIKLNFNEYKAFFKMNYCHRKPAFMASIDEITSKPSFFIQAIFVQEMETLLKEEVHLANEEAKDNQLLLQIPFDKVLLGITAYHEAMMQSHEVVGNTDLQTTYDAAISREADRIINVFLGMSEKLKIVFPTTLILQQEWEKLRPNHRFEAGRNITLSGEDRRLNDILNRSINRQGYIFLISNYLAGFGDFTNPLEIESLQLNEEYHRYRLNDYKSRLEEFYIEDITSNPDLSLSSIKQMKQSFKNFYSFYNIPNIVEGGKGLYFDLIKANNLLKVFAENKSPLRRLFITNQTDGELLSALSLVDEKFTTHFGSGEHISMFEEDKLIQNISLYFCWEKKEVENLMYFLTTDMLSSCTSKSLLQNPFIKINNRIYWLGRLFKKRRWSTFLKNKLFQDKNINPKVINKVGNGMEEAVRDLLDSAGFQVLPEHGKKLEFKTKTEEKGDIDLLALNGNELIIAEVKSGLIVEEPDKVNKIETLKLVGLATQQIEKINYYVAEAWDSCIRKCFKSEVMFKDLKIYSLIVTDFYEGDLMTFKNGVSKISLLELDVIVKNNKKRLYERVLSFLGSLNSFNQDYNEIQVPVDWDLWNDKAKFSIEILADCVNNNKVWKNLAELKNF